MQKSFKFFSIVLGCMTIGNSIDASATPASEEVTIRYALSLKGAGGPLALPTSGLNIEDWQSWSEGQVAKIEVPNSHRNMQLTEVVLPDTGALISPQHPQQQVNVAIQVQEYNYTLEHSTHDIVIKFPELGPVALTKILFYFPSLCRASEAFPGNPDSRELGLRVNSLIATYASAATIDEEIVRYRLSLNGEGEQLPSTSGFSIEDWQSWSNSQVASITIPPSHNNKQIREAKLLSTGALISPQHPEQRVNVAIQVHPPYTYTQDKHTQDIVMKLPGNVSGASTGIIFQTPDSCLVSKAFPGNPDSRELGLRMNSLIATYASVKSTNPALSPTPPTPGAVTPPPPPPPMPPKFAPKKAPKPTQLASAAGSAPAATPLPMSPKKPITVKGGPAVNAADIAKQALSVVLNKTPQKKPQGQVNPSGVYNRPALKPINLDLTDSKA